MTGALTVADLGPRAPEGDTTNSRTHDNSATTMPIGLYQRVVRVVSYLFIAAVAATVTLTGGQHQALVYVLLVGGIILLVLFQDLLPATSLARWRLPLEGGATIAFLTVLLILTGGFHSPYFFGYVLLLGAGSLWATGLAPAALMVVTAVAYLFAVAVASGPTLLMPDGIARVGFNVVTLGLVTYVAWTIGREQRRAREEALRLSRFDSLTSLYSRAFFTSTVEREIPRAARTGRPFAMLMFDLDGLKAANDRFGHESGDRLLQAVADVLRGDVRVTDVAARYAGDEFVLLLPETDLAGALRVAEKVRVDISRLALPHDGSLIRTSASIGLVTYPEDGRAWAELIRRADLAMYEAKRRGRDQIVHYARAASAAPVTQPPASAALAPPRAVNPSAHVAVGPGHQSGSGTEASMGRASAAAYQAQQTDAAPPVRPTRPAPPVQPPAGGPQIQPAATGPPVTQPAVVPQVAQALPLPSPSAPPQTVTSGVPYDIPPESPSPAPWEERGG